MEAGKGVAVGSTGVSVGRGVVIGATAGLGGAAVGGEDVVGARVVGRGGKVGGEDKPAVSGDSVASMGDCPEQDTRTRRINVGTRKAGR